MKLSNIKSLFIIRVLKYIKFKYNDKVAHRKLKKMCNINVELDFYKIVSDIITNKKSLARFGDSEIYIMLGHDPKDYQEPNSELSEKLKKVLKCPDNNILIGINDAFKGYDNNTYVSRKFWAYFISKYFDDFYKELNPKVNYINSAFCRIYIRKTETSDVENKFIYMKKIWEGRDIVFVEGEFSRLGVNNDLFDNSKGIERILCPSKNAYDYYEEIFNEIRKLSSDKLIIIALGSTATVLAFDLSKEGYQVLDLGHIDLEYEWFKMGAKDAVQVKGKYTNEAVDRAETIENVDDERYIESIIKKIGID